MSEYSEEFLKLAHKHCFKNSPAIWDPEVCGCFYCKNTFSSKEIDEFWDDEQTAVCPLCGIDSVIYSSSGLPIQDPNFLAAMHERWFERVVSLEEVLGGARREPDSNEEE